MPTLEWIGKDKVINHHQQVPYRVLEEKYTYNAEKSDNMIIRGDNLEALKALLPKYEGRIKCIYIDPPYNTGNEGWVYNDNVNDPKICKWLGEVVGKEGEDLSRHDKWLCMMYPRLRLLSKLLSADGCLAISIGIHEVNNLLAICRDIFSSKQIMAVTVKTSGGKPSGSFNVTHEYIVFILPSDFKANPSDLSINEDSSPFHSMTLASFFQEQRPNQVYPIYVDENGLIVSCGRSLQDLIDDGVYTGRKEDFEYDYSDSPEGTSAVWPVSNKGLPCVWRQIAESTMEDWKKGYIRVIPQKSKKTKNKWAIQFLSDGIKEKIENGIFSCKPQSESCPTLELIDYHTAGVTIPTIWDDKSFYTSKGTDQIESLFGQKTTFTYAKPLDLIKEIIGRISDPGDTILDSFAGSGTTAHAVLHMNKAHGSNRKFILVEMMDYADSITAERVKRVIDGYGSGKQAVEGTGGNFTFYDLGQTLLLPDGNLNEEVDTAKIREYIWYMETKTPLGEAAAENPYYLGENNNTGYYFFYEKDHISTLGYEFLSTIKEKTESYLIYADLCTIPDEELKRYNITFKKIPRDIAKL